MDAEEAGTPVRDAGTPVREGSSWFLQQEAECSDMDGSEASEESEAEDLIDDAPVRQGNSLLLFQQQEAQADEQHLSVFKRKYCSPKEKVADLSPRLGAISISPIRGPQVKRRLFNPEQDSGLDLSLQNEAVDVVEPTENQVPSDADRTVRHVDGQTGGLNLNILRSANRKATMLGLFKDAFGVPYGELTRQFRSDKTGCFDWVVAAYAVREPFFESGKAQLRQHCRYTHVTYRPMPRGTVLLMLVSFNNQKCRDTVNKLIRTLFNVHELLLMLEPPKIRSVAAAMYWYKQSLTNATETFGELPEWIKKLILINHQTDEEVKFDFSQFVQWAYDNEYQEEHEIAYNYASIADEDSNAAAWLGLTGQAKVVKDVATMVRYYRRAEMNRMSMSNWIHNRKKKSKPGQWQPIVNFLKYQGVAMVAFINALKSFLKGTPKKNCLVIWGPPNTGKSWFCMSLMHFLGGRVLSHVNSNSHFWLQPLGDAKVALLDDATTVVWDYFDRYMRNACDGNPISLDMKHKAPVQIKCPPLLITSNIDVKADDRWLYLHSRLVTFHFPNLFPFEDDGSPVYQFNDENWNSLFTRLWRALDLSDQEDEGDDGDPAPAFRCCTRKTNESFGGGQL
uniref:Replication protein E1 n=1 Tax=Equus caballus papillomavirus 1 TaxID=333920 RepID=A0A5J6SJD9_ECPV1|nr:protein E1 [Equus caballus papillomavirus 1]